MFKALKSLYLYLFQVQMDGEYVLQMYKLYFIANRYLNALLLLNALFDPVIYAFRLRHVQLGYRRLCSRCFFCVLLTHRYQNKTIFIMITTTQEILIKKRKISEIKTSKWQSQDCWNSFLLLYYIWVPSVRHFTLYFFR